MISRGTSRFIVATISVLITLIVGVLFLNVNIEFLAVNWGLFTLSLFIGVIMLAMMGLILAGVTLMIANHGWFIGDATTGALYLFSGAIFPLSVLPAFFRHIGYLMPITYWLELLRRSLVSSVSEVFPTLSNFSNLDLLGILIGLTAIFAVIAAIVFYWCDHQARERGMIDMVTNY